MTYTLTVGLEVHAELKTATKMFCSSRNDPNEKVPNAHTCPICLGHPGTLPVINKKAVEHVLTVGAAVGGTLADYTEFDRKNYFYPDIPKGYQISQYKYPLVSGGALSGVALTRIHLEEDTARSAHDMGEYSLVDFNRAGVPLMELVTEPVIHSSEEAGAFARELQILLRTLGVSDANMEKGEMRVEANISISKTADFGTKVEVKNLNSFRSVERAIAYEVARQSELLDKGEKVVQETRGWDEVKERTFSQRKKESAHDYRYFPDPDLPKLKLSTLPECTLEQIEKTLPELPWEKRARLLGVGLKEDTVEVLVQDTSLGALYDEAAQSYKDNTALLKKTANYITSDLVGIGQKQITAKGLGALMLLVEEGLLSSRGAKDTLSALNESGRDDAEALAGELGLLQKSDDSFIDTLVSEILSQNAQVVEECKNGKESSLQYLVGQGMKLSKGAANPQLLGEKLRQKILS